MKHPLHPLLAIGALALAPLAPLSAADLAEDCRQMAAEEAVPVEDLADYIAECVAMLENEYPDEGGEGEESMPETDAPDGGGSPEQD
ncbi:MAG: hypothetical protein ACM3ST_08435 [Bdellovibrio bacteriovorus]